MPRAAAGRRSRRARVRRASPVGPGLSLADVRAFAEVFYRPERMTVVISGPIDPGWEKSLFAKLPASRRGQEATPTAPIRRPLAAWHPPSGPAPPDAALPTHTANVNAPELWMAWRVPPAIGVDARKASVIARVVRRGAVEPPRRWTAPTTCSTSTASRSPARLSTRGRLPLQAARRRATRSASATRPRPRSRRCPTPRSSTSRAGCTGAT